MEIDEKIRKLLCERGAEYISSCQHFENPACPKTCRYAIERDLNNLKDEILGNLPNSMQIIKEDWERMGRYFKTHRKEGIPSEESFYQALLKCGGIVLRNSK